MQRVEFRSLLLKEESVKKSMTWHHREDEQPQKCHSKQNMDINIWLFLRGFPIPNIIFPYQAVFSLTMSVLSRVSAASLTEIMLPSFFVSPPGAASVLAPSSSFRSVTTF